MQNYWGVESAPQICLRFSFVVKSFGVAVCWNSEDYWCQKEVSAGTLLALGQTLVIISILIWCLPSIHVILLFSTSMQRHLTTDWGHLGSSFFPSYCTMSLMCLWPTKGECMRFSVLNLISQYHFFIYIYTLMHITETGNLWQVIKIYSVLKFTVWCNVIFIFWHFWFGIVNGKLSTRASEGGPNSASPTFGPSTRSAGIKGCYFRYCVWFADIDPAFKVNRGNLDIRQWVGFCINCSWPLLEGLGYSSD